MSTMNENPFESIYGRHTWKGNSLSGPGSDGKRTAEFRHYLAKFLKERQIKSIVDFGCGDWSYSKLLDLSNIRYIGIDVVPGVIKQNNKTYQQENVSFKLIDPTSADCPTADLFLCKDVLQHLPVSKVQQLLASAKSFKYALLVNDIAYQVRAGWRNLWRWHDASEINVDIPAGGYRLLSLRDSPFCLKAKQVLVYDNIYEGMHWTKEVLLYERDPV